MSNYTPLYTNIWNDAKFTEYTAEQQLIFIYLISNQSCNISGIYQISPKQIAFSTNIDKNTVVDTLKSFNQTTLEYDAAAGIVFIKNHFKYNLNKIGNAKTMMYSLLKNCSLTPHDDFWEGFFGKYQKELNNLISKAKKSKNGFVCNDENSLLCKFVEKSENSLKPDCEQSASSLNPDSLRVRVSISNSKDIKEEKKKDIKKEKYLEEFEEFWKTYLAGMINTPLGSKKKAYDIYKKAKQTPDKMIEGLKGYLRECQKKGTYTAAVPTFLNQERYNDYLKSERDVLVDKEKIRKDEERKREIESLFKINKNNPKFNEIMSTINFIGNDSSKLFFSREEKEKKIFVTDTKFNRDWICSEYGGRIKQALGDCIIIAKEDPSLRKLI